MNDVITFIKAVIIGAVSELLSFFTPIEDNFLAMVWLFGLNFLFGMLADVLDGREFSAKKAFSCVAHAAIFFVLCASMYGIGHYQNMNNGVLLQCVSSFCWILVYCYSTNIVRNVRSMLRRETPAYKAVDMLYNSLTLAFVKGLPIVGEILKQRKEERHENK